MTPADRPRLEVWVPVVVSLAGVVTVVMIAVLADAAWSRTSWTGHASARAEIGGALGAVGAVGLLVATWTSRYRDVSPWARGAVTLVCVHIAFAVAAWALSYRLKPTTNELPLLSVVPAPQIAVAVIVLLVVVACVHGRVRRLTGAPGWLRGTVVFALAYLLLLGVWLPIAVPEDSNGTWYNAAQLARGVIAKVLVPPAAVACVTAVITVLRPRWLRALGPVALVIAAMFTIGGMAARDAAPVSALVVYASYVHVLFAVGGFALASLAVLAWMHARVLRANRADAARPAPWVQRGIVEAAPSEQVVGAWHVDGWLAGLRTSLTGFTLRTERGDVLAVPGGARLVAPVPAATVGASRDELIPALRAGDEVTVSGFVAPHDEGPYRTAGLPVPGSDGLVVTSRRRHDDSIGRDVVLVLYRPCVLFLIVAMLAALPGIVGNEEPPRTRIYSVRQYAYGD